ncbi:SMAD/FHA domain-containing protein [Exidia glandulosa HHB12029]|uniref:SMAD/FHA domain-containing protein n=1 Tax=Exidia glandulosa HHB12029 TaxID=1314781 RepID=A0A165DT03_EXIGL|nr:SMAD/FHA domain-containing protein [Exidia glandulosa HHB12029]
MPTLTLDPLNGSFESRVLELGEDPIEVGRRSTPAQAAAQITRQNAYFTTKAISRRHALIWYSDGKIWMEDMGTPNGTYLNSVRLNANEPTELHDQDEVVFGMDFFHEGALIHQKIAARCTCTTWKVRFVDSSTITADSDSWAIATVRA